MANKKGVKRKKYKMEIHRSPYNNYTKKIKTSYRSPEDYSQWEEPSQKFDINEFMQEIY